MSLVMDKEALKKSAAEAAIPYIHSIREDFILGVGSGTTVHYFIDALKEVKKKIIGAVPSSNETANRLKALGISLVDLNSVDELPLYVDGADEINPAKQMIKGGGGA